MGLKGADHRLREAIADVLLKDVGLLVGELAGARIGDQGGDPVDEARDVRDQEMAALVEQHLAALALVATS